MCKYNVNICCEFNYNILRTFIYKIYHFILSLGI